MEFHVLCGTRVKCYWDAEYRGQCWSPHSRADCWGRLTGHCSRGVLVLRQINEIALLAFMESVWKGSTKELLSMKLLDGQFNKGVDIG